MATLSNMETFFLRTVSSVRNIGALRNRHATHIQWCIIIKRAAYSSFSSGNYINTCSFASKWTRSASAKVNYNHKLPGLSIAKHFSSCTSNYEKVSEETLSNHTNENLNIDDGMFNAIDLSSNVNLAEESFLSMGLVSMKTPSGWIQATIDYLHTCTDLPWWACIAAMTVVLKCFAFPLVVMSRKLMVNMQNHTPYIIQLQQRLTTARANGRSVEVGMLSLELEQYMKKHNVRPMLATCTPLFQAPIFISMFIALRGMAKNPVDSFKNGGFLWFSNLTVPDPYYGLPLLSAATLLLVIELGAESGVKTKQMGNIKNFLRILPFISIPFTIYMPASVLTYWFINNSLTLLQAIVLKNAKVKEVLGIPNAIPPPHMPNIGFTTKGFGKSLYESLSNANITNEINDRQRVGALKFKDDKKKLK